MISLIRAVRTGKSKRVKRDIVVGSCLEEKDSEGNTALCVAAAMGLDQIVSLLLDHGAYVNAKNNEGVTALHVAAERGFTNIVEKLIMKNASLTRDASGSTPLDLAIIKKRKKVIKRLTSTYFNLVKNYQCADFRMTPVHLTVNKQSLNTTGQTVRSEDCLLGKSDPDPRSDAVEMISPPNKLSQLLYHEESINCEDLLERFRKVAYIKKQTASIRLAHHRARERQLCKIQERQNCHAAKNYQILFDRESQEEKIHRDSIRRRASMMKRMKEVEPTQLHSTKLERAVERAIKSGGRRAAYYVEKRAAQFLESRVAAASEKKRQNRRAARKNKKKKRESTTPHSKQGKASRCVSAFSHKPIENLDSKQTGIPEGKTRENVSYASSFPMPQVQEFSTFEHGKSERAPKNSKGTKRNNLPVPTSEENKCEDRTIMKIFIEDLLIAARKRNDRKHYKKLMKKYKKKRKYFYMKKEDYWVPSMQNSTEIIEGKSMDKRESYLGREDKIFDKNAMSKMDVAAPDNGIEDISSQLNHNVDMTTLGINGTSRIHIAARKKNEKELIFLSKSGVNVDTRDKDGRTPLHEAALRGLTQSVRVSLQFGSNIDAKENKFGSSPLHLASLRCQIECVKTLVGEGADLLITDHRGQTPLHVSAWRGHATCIATLIDLGTPVDAPCKDGSGRTASHLATTKGHLTCIFALLEKGAAVNSVDRAERSALFIACREGHEDCVRLLSENGANLNLKSYDNDSALHVAAFNGNEECISVLSENGARVDVRGKDKRTALHVAAERGHDRCVQLLLDSGASVQLTDRFKKTPLYLAAEGNHMEAVRSIVGAGASCSAKKKRKKSPFNVAEGDRLRSLLT